ncbi:hypothetical protein CYMTET_13962 [Cymbomonas tetramitiformis]|uniref:Uncharacterized protein n=1 Tax=Cymbomonas tetramitiformis TaxID=36881 RepID=A0AAE0GIF9_9CHLO|nr:hypothetical protein CYMTET_13962 [Cymbomonas tetramitiformis]
MTPEWETAFRRNLSTPNSSWHQSQKAFNSPSFGANGFWVDERAATPSGLVHVEKATKVFRFQNRLLQQEAAASRAQTPAERRTQSRGHDGLFLAEYDRYALPSSLSENFDTSHAASKPPPALRSSKPLRRLAATPTLNRAASSKGDVEWYQLVQDVPRSAPATPASDQIRKDYRTQQKARDFSLSRSRTPLTGIRTQRRQPASSLEKSEAEEVAQPPWHFGAEDSQHAISQPRKEESFTLWHLQGATRKLESMMWDRSLAELSEEAPGTRLRGGDGAGLGQRQTTSPPSTRPSQQASYLQEERMRLLSANRHQANWQRRMEAQQEEEALLEERMRRAEQMGTREKSKHWDEFVDGDIEQSKLKGPSISAVGSRHRAGKARQQRRVTVFRVVDDTEQVADSADEGTALDNPAKTELVTKKRQSNILAAPGQGAPKPARRGSVVINKPQELLRDAEKTSVWPQENHNSFLSLHPIDPQRLRLKGKEIKLLLGDIFNNHRLTAAAMLRLYAEQVMKDESLFLEDITIPRRGTVRTFSIDAVLNHVMQSRSGSVDLAALHQMDEAENQKTGEGHQNMVMQHASRLLAIGNSKSLALELACMNYDVLGEVLTLLLEDDNKANYLHLHVNLGHPAFA